MDERDGDYLCNAIGMMIALYEMSLIQDNAIAYFDYLLINMPIKIASRIGLWLNAQKNTFYPCSSETVLIEKIAMAKSSGERCKMKFFLDKIRIPK